MTDVLYAKLAVQVAPQVSPAGDEVTVPVPSPAGTIVIARGPAANVAVTDLAAFIVTTQVAVAVPLHAPEPAPDQPLNVSLPLGVAVSVTTVLNGWVIEHVAPQLMPVGDEVTTPVPVPAVVTVSVCGPAAKVAVIARA